MSQATRRKLDNDAVPGQMVRGVREGLLFLAIAMALYLLVSLVSYHPDDPGWSNTGFDGAVHNAGGLAGAWFADVFFYVFGYFAYLFPFMAGFAGVMFYRDRDDSTRSNDTHVALRITGFVLTLAAGSGIATLHFSSLLTGLPIGAGGILGDVIGNGLVRPFNFLGATLFLLALFLSGITLFTGVSWVTLVDVIGRFSINAFVSLRNRIDVWRDERAIKAAQDPAPRKAPKPKKEEKIRPAARIEPVIIEAEIDKPAARPRPVKTESETPVKAPNPSANALPTLSLLDDAQPSGKSLSKDALTTMSRLVEAKLLDFGIEVQVVSVNPGPVVTRYEMQPAPGIKVSQINGLAKDLARALSVISVRVVDVIPGKPYIGLEIPNEHREIVRLKEILQAREELGSVSPLGLALGKDIAGRPVVVDLARMPHLLVAGTTGSGKSVAVNAMILSFLYNASPKDVRLIMIDPKMLELSVYEGIPHLLAPVVTDMKEAANALRWSVAEMDRRYRLMAALGVRNISGFNQKVAEAAAAGTPLLDPIAKREEGVEPAVLTPLPYIVVVVDELADMMMVVGKKVEELIARLAQKARASGIHLLLATQRPSVDVLTGLIKANIPTRISFQVSSKIDSRTILDQMGAEQLLGHGDMLYLPPGTGVPVRVHGAFVADQEVHKVVNFLRQCGSPDYIEEILQEPILDGGSYTGEDGGDAETDALYDEAVRIVTETRRSSISSVQRRLKIGYNRAARMIEQMERAGILGPLQSNGMREVLAPPPPGD